MRCISYAVAESYDIDELAKFLRSQDYEPKFYDDVIYVQRGKADVFIFAYGAISFWGSEEDGELQFIEEIKNYAKDSLELFNRESTEYFFNTELANSTVEEEADCIILHSDDALIRLSFSHALSQSAKLSVFENIIYETIVRNRHIPQELAKNGKISLSRKKLAKKTGELFAQRNSINLHSDVLDLPEFFWRRPKYEPYYHLGCDYMELKTRLEILNKRLDIIHELYDIISNELKHIHSSRLEWIIIILILIEVVTQVVLHFFKL